MLKKVSGLSEVAYEFFNCKILEIAIIKNTFHQSQQPLIDSINLS